MQRIAGCEESVIEERLPRRIRIALEARHAMHVGEISQRLGVDENETRMILEEMVRSGEVHRLRPIDYERDDHDFFALTKTDDAWAMCAEVLGNVRARAMKAFIRAGDDDNVGVGQFAENYIG
jgi:predicted ArsR family transcriptional regulator